MIPVSLSNTWTALPRKVKPTAVPAARVSSPRSAASSLTGTTITASRPQVRTWMWTALPIISDTSTSAGTEPGPPVRVMCSGRMPSTTSRLSAPAAARRRHFSGDRATAAPPTSTLYRSPVRVRRASKVFIWGEPMKPATKRLAGWWNTSWGVPTCWTKPSFMMTIRSPRVMASV